MFMRKFFLNKNPIVLLLVVSTLLSLFWFRNGNIMGVGESGLIFYDFSRVLDLVRFSWAEFCLGNVVGIVTASAPTFWFLLQLQNIKIPNFLIQALFINFSFFISGLGVYLLVGELFPNLSKKSRLLSAFFYLFNPISLVNVWTRFLYNYMFFMALLPIALFLFLKGISSKDYRFAILTSLATVFFSYSLTSTVFNFLLWFVLILAFCFSFFCDKKDFFFYIKYFFLTLFSFLFFNSWWLGQLLSFLYSSGYKVAVMEFFTQAGNIGTLVTLSGILGKLSEIFRFSHKTFFSKGPWWAKIYNLPPIVFLEFLISGIVFWTIFKYKRIRNILFCGILFLLAAFLMKGSEPPLGYIFQLAFEKLSILQVFRNPFEKFGFLFSLASSLIFAFGIEKITLLLKNRIYKKFVLFTALFTVLVVWGFPFLTGLVFTSNEGTSDDKLADYEVKVPSYYKDANNWLTEENPEFRFVSLPIDGEPINYSWEKPYRGVELSTTLFKNPNISLNTSIPYYNKVVSELDWIFLNNHNFEEVLNVLDARYVINRFDIDWKRRGMRNPVVVEELLKSQENFVKVASFGKLDFWKSNLINPYGKFYATQKLVESIPYPAISDLGFYELNSKVTLYSGSNLKANEKIIHPSRRFYLEYPPATFFEERQDIFPHVRFLPSSPFYPFVLLKEKIEKLFINDSTELSEWILTILGKRLNEFRQSVQKKNFKAAALALNRYSKELQEFGILQKKAGLVNESSDYSDNWLQEKNYGLFARHLGVLSEDYQLVGTNDLLEKVNTTKSLLKETLVELGISPKFDYIDNESMPVAGRKTFQVSVPEDGDYELLIDMKNWDKFYEIEGFEIQFQIDNQVLSKAGNVGKNGIVSFGKFNFSKGVHEIGFNTPKQKNLIDAPTEFSMVSSQGIQEKAFELKNFDPYSAYQISFDYLIKKGSGIKIYFEADNDRVVDGEVKYSFSKFFGPDEKNYDFDYKKYVLNLTPNSGATSARIGVSVTPWNDCFSIYKGLFSYVCRNESFKHKYDKTTEVVVKNLKVQKVPNPRLFLHYLTDKTNTNINGELPIITYDKINSTLYKVKVTSSREKYYLIFSELFNSGWQVEFPDGQILSEDKHFLANGFANGWEIDLKGDYELLVKYAPQDFLEKGSIISLISILGGIAVLIYQTLIRRHASN